MMDSAEKNSVFKSVDGNIFHFRCHKEIECFTRCCAKLRLILTPYDILRMKNRLGLSSGDFLDRHTDTLFNEHPRFPMVKLLMKKDDGQLCPFVTQEGCTIYEDRPAACRLYPLGRASTLVKGENSAREKFFIVDEDHCLGFNEDKTWRLDEWLDNENVREYNAMNDSWLEIINSKKSLGPKENIAKKQQMFYMASYNLDQFRKFIFESRFLKTFDVKKDLIEVLAIEDAALMKFAFEWLKFSLYGEKTLRLKNDPNLD